MFIMHQANRKSVTARRPRRSFTLIELLMVIVIISILMSLAFAAFNGVMKTARVAEVKVEVDALSSALADFKAKFGFYPPSKITLYGSRDGWNSDPKSRAVIRRMFPQFDFSTNGGAQWNSRNHLTGAECLVFFLGGVPKGGIPNGFSKNPRLPFSNSGNNRIGPLFNFDVSRLRLSNTEAGGVPMQFYVHPLSSQDIPYLYVSAYNGRGYASPNISPFDKQSNDPEDPFDDDDLDVFPEAIEDTSGKLIVNPANMKFVYRQGSSKSSVWNPKSFQIICPGFDDDYGRGGKFDPITAELDLIGTREPERDNITNFHTGMLSP